MPIFHRGAALGVLLLFAAAPAQQKLRLVPTGEFTTRGGEFTHVSFSADGRRMVSSGEHGDLILWDAEKLQRIRRLPALSKWPCTAELHPTRPIVALVFSPRGKRSVLALRDLETGVHRVLVRSKVLHAGWSRDGDRLACTAWVDDQLHAIVLGDLRLDRATRTGWKPRLREVRIPGRTHTRPLFTADGQSLILTSPSRHSDHYFVDVENGGVPVRRDGILRGLAADGSPVFLDGARVTNRGKELDAVGEKNAVVVVSDRNGHVAAMHGWVPKAFARLTAPRRATEVPTHSWLKHLFVGPRGTVAVTDACGRLHVYRGDRYDVLGGHTGTAHALAFSRDGRFVAATGTGAVVIRDVAGRNGGDFTGSTSAVPGATGSDFLIADADGVHTYSPAIDRITRRGRPWPAERPALLADALPLSLDALALPGSRRILFRSLPRGHGEDVAVLDVKKGEFTRLRSPAESDPTVFDSIELLDAAATHDHRIALVRGTRPGGCGMVMLGFTYFGMLEVFDRDLELLHRENAEASQTGVAFGPGGRRLLVTDNLGHLRILDTTTFETIVRRKFEEPAGAVRWLDARRLLVLDRRGFLVLRAGDLREDARVKIPGLDPDSCTGRFAISPDRKHLAIANETSVRVFRLENDK